MEQRGHPKIVTAAGKAYDEEAWRRLWEISEQLTDVHYEFAKPRRDRSARRRRGRARVGRRATSSGSASSRCSAQVNAGRDPRSAPADGRPSSREPFSTCLRDLDEVLLPGVTHWQHPRYFAYFATSASEPGDPRRAARGDAQLGRVPVANRSGGDRARGRRARLGGTAARPAGRLARPHRGHRLDLDADGDHRGARGDRARGDRVLGAGALGGGQGGARCSACACARSPSDAGVPPRSGRGSETCSEAAVVVATVGTTASTSVDPVPAIADACERAGTWLHVDAAYAGAAMVCPEHRWAFEGVERADSLVVNAHKWMLTPMDCSLLWTRRPAGPAPRRSAWCPSSCARRTRRTRYR